MVSVNGAMFPMVSKVSLTFPELSKLFQSFPNVSEGFQPFRLTLPTPVLTDTRFNGPHKCSPSVQYMPHPDPVGTGASSNAAPGFEAMPNEHKMPGAPKRRPVMGKDLHHPHPHDFPGEGSAKTASVGPDLRGHPRASPPQYWPPLRWSDLAG